MSGPSLAWVISTSAIAHKLDVMPLPPGINEAVVGKWHLVVNNSKLEMSYHAPGRTPVDLPPFEVFCEHLEYLSFGLLGPFAGMIGGYSEDRFIGDLIPHLSSQALADFADELERFEEYQALKGARE